MKFLPCSLLLCSVSLASAGEISGRVTLTGTPKPEQEITLDATCGALTKTKLTTRHFVVSKDKGLANVFVYIKEGAAKAPPAGPAPLLDQVNCLYEPYVMGVVA